MLEGTTGCCKEGCDCAPAYEHAAFVLMKKAFEILCQADATRENSLAKTKLEEAMMWCNKDRAMKGQLDKTPTHVE
jgi:hypothetical protein